MNSALGLEGKPLAPPSGGGRWGIDYREGIAPDPLSCQVGKPQLRKGRASPSNSSGYPLPWESREESGRKGQFLSARGTQGDSRDTPGGGGTLPAWAALPILASFLPQPFWELVLQLSFGWRTGWGSRAPHLWPLSPRAQWAVSSWSVVLWPL